MGDSSSEIVRLMYQEVYGEASEDRVRRLPARRKAGKYFGYCPKKSYIISSVSEYVRECGVNRTASGAA